MKLLHIRENCHGAKLDTGNYYVQKQRTFRGAKMSQLGLGQGWIFFLKKTQSI